MFFAFVMLLFLKSREGGQASEEKMREAVLTVLNDQVGAWNDGDLEGFMKGYWQSDELTFFSGGSVRQGWQETYDRYRWRYQGDHKDLGVANLVAQSLSAQAPAGVPAGVPLQSVVAVGLLDSKAFAAQMGRLRFENLLVTPTGPKTAVVRGRFRLLFKDRTELIGLFTLLFRQETDGWVIVHDHTSS
jgi:hypothetical protein